MRTNTGEESYLLLSGIQHMAFCERQWALIHIEQQWNENDRTVEGKHMHERVDDPFDSESRGDLHISRSLPLISHNLRLRGVADVVEYWRVESGGIKLNGKSGLWMPRPVEYKRGHQKTDDRDEVQLCAQAICLEEMHGLTLFDGDLFYGETRRRQHVKFDEALRDRVKLLSKKMALLFEQGTTPPAIQGTNCKLCSLIDICMPKLTMKNKSVSEYIDHFIKGSDT
jgi:CRISPR-associated exonuclease Cas4